MIYVCAKCKFLFERKNEPSKCPSCENQCITEANSGERQTYKRLYDKPAPDEQPQQSLTDETN